MLISFASLGLSGMQKTKSVVEIREYGRTTWIIDPPYRPEILPGGLVFFDGNVYEASQITFRATVQDVPTSPEVQAAHATSSTSAQQTPPAPIKRAILQVGTLQATEAGTLSLKIRMLQIVRSQQRAEGTKYRLDNHYGANPKVAMLRNTGSSTKAERAN